MNWVDIVIIVVVGTSIVFGVKRGLIKEILTLVALIAGIIIATRSYDEGAKIMAHFVNNTNLAHLLSFVVIFTLVCVFFFLCGIVLKKLIRIAKLTAVDRMGGLVFGFIRGGIAVGVALAFVIKYPIFGTGELVKDAVLAPFFIHFIESLWKLVPPELFESVQ